MQHLKNVIGLVTFSISLGVSIGALAASDNVKSAVGIVEQATQVTLTSNNTGRGAAAGAVIGGVRDTNDRGASVAKGAVVGGLVGRARSSSKAGMQYIIKVAPNNLITVVSEQTEMRKGDCVSVQQSGKMATVKRIDKSKCDSVAAAPKTTTSTKPANTTKSAAAAKPASNDVCAMAKQELSAAKTKEALDLAKQKMDMLCK